MYIFCLLSFHSGREAQTTIWLADLTQLFHFMAETVEACDRQRNWSVVISGGSLPPSWPTLNPAYPLIYRITFWMINRPRTVRDSDILKHDSLHTTQWSCSTIAWTWYKLLKAAIFWSDDGIVMSDLSYRQSAAWLSRRYTRRCDLKNKQDLTHTKQCEVV